MHAAVASAKRVTAAMSIIIVLTAAFCRHCVMSTGPVPLLSAKSLTMRRCSHDLVTACITTHHEVFPVQQIIQTCSDSTYPQVFTNSFLLSWQSVKRPEHLCSALKQYPCCISLRVSIISVKPCLTERRVILWCTFLACRTHVTLLACMQRPIVVLPTGDAQR